MEKPILFFDGVCSLCNGFVDFIFRYDTKAKFLVASLQGNKASEVLPSEYLTDLNTVVLYKNGNLYTKSSAVLMVLKDLSFPWSCFVIFYIIPAFIRDFIYMQISEKRYLIFGKTNTCRLPAQAERERFLD